MTDHDKTAAIQLVELEEMQEVEEMEKLELELDKADKVEKELESRLEGLRLKVGQLEKLVRGMQVRHLPSLMVLMKYQNKKCRGYVQYLAFDFLCSCLVLTILRL